MNRDKNGRFIKTKTSKELSVGDKITSFDQLKEGMIVDFTTVDFTAHKTEVNNAVIVYDEGRWYALHNNDLADGDRPNHSKMKRHKKNYAWDLGSTSKEWPFGEDYKHMIFRGWYKLEEKIEKKPVYKIGDFVKFSFSAKTEIVGIHGNYVWLFDAGIYHVTSIGNVSPWIDEPVKPKYQVGDLVFTKRSITVEIIEISKDGVSYIGKDMFGDTGSFTEDNILRKIGTVTKE
jgi:hypothetical protein